MLELYICIYMYTSIHIYVRIYVCMYMCICVQESLYTYMICIHRELLAVIGMVWARCSLKLPIHTKEAQAKRGWLPIRPKQTLMGPESLKSAWAFSSRPGAPWGC